MEIDLAGAVGATASMPDDETIKGGYEFTRTFRRDGESLSSRVGFRLALLNSRLTSI